VTARRYRYGPWAGGPDPLAPPYDVRDAVDAVGQDVLAGGSVRSALRDLLRRGIDHRGGLDDLVARARRLRREAGRRGNLEGTVTRARARLDQALAAEREVLARRDDDGARFAEAWLDALPRSTAGAIEELSSYDWASDEARATYASILDGLRREVLDQRFAGLRDALQGADPARDPAAAQRLRDMLGDLNALLAKHARGEDTTDAFAAFMAAHGDLFPERPRDVDELVDLLARRAAAGERLLQSLSSTQRAELAGLVEQAVRSAGVADELADLTTNLRTLRPDLAWGRREQMRGDEPLGYGDAARALADIAELDDLLQQLGQDHPGATLDDVDVSAVDRVLGRSAADQVRQLQELERELQRQGWFSGAGDDVRLSAKALRRLGESALRTVFATLERGPSGQHDLRSAGAAGERTGATRPWAFGDEQPIDVVRTVGNAVRRSVADGAAAVGGRSSRTAANDPGGPLRCTRVRLSVEDFEVVETERRAGAAVALCVDLSFSMIMEGRWAPMKTTALALSHLTSTRFAQDALAIIGFNRYAHPLSVGELVTTEPDMVQGTNLQHALRLAGRHLRRHADAEPVVMVITDGEPTAHLDDAGEALFSWPPTAETVQRTVLEVDHLARYGAMINWFMLGDDPGLRRFVDAMARRSGGRVLTPTPEDLGRYVVTDYLHSRRGGGRGR
jgi:uncharacterized protein with von Willebrand factor type A (vWA) domain